MVAPGSTVMFPYRPWTLTACWFRVRMR